MTNEELDNLRRETEVIAEQAKRTQGYTARKSLHAHYDEVSEAINDELERRIANHKHAKKLRRLCPTCGQVLVKR